MFTAIELTGKPTTDELAASPTSRRVSLGGEHVFGGLTQIAY
ncbi:hypothetical protein [Mycobacterium sp. E787]|nr:hypothetical protein [Mycobacterium sp. E787]